MEVYFKEEITSESTANSDEVLLYKYFSNPVNKMYHRFLLDAYSRLCLVNTELQKSTPSISEEQYIVCKLYTNLLSMYVRPSCMNSTTDVSKIDPKDKNTFRPTNRMILPDDVKTMLEESSLSSPDKRNFRKNCRAFLVELCTSFRKRFDFSNENMLEMRFFHPKNALSLQFRVEQGPGLDKIFEQVPLLNRPEKDTSPHQFQELVNGEWEALALHEFPEDITREDCQDIFWRKIRDYVEIDGRRPFARVGQLALNALCIPNSNAEPERVWSILGIQKTKFRGRMLFKTLRGGMLSNQCVKDRGGCDNFEPTYNMYLRMALNLNDEVKDKRTIQDSSKYKNTEMTDEYLQRCREAENFRHELTKKMKLRDEYFKHNDDDYQSDVSIGSDNGVEMHHQKIHTLLDTDSHALNDTQNTQECSQEIAPGSGQSRCVPRASSTLSLHESTARSTSTASQVPLFNVTRQTSSRVRSRNRRRGSIATASDDSLQQLPNGLINNCEYYMKPLIYRRPLDEEDSTQPYVVATVQLTSETKLFVGSEDYQSLAPSTGLTGAVIDVIVVILSRSWTSECMAMRTTDTFLFFEDYPRASEWFRMNLPASGKILLPYVNGGHWRLFLIDLDDHTYSLLDPFFHTQSEMQNEIDRVTLYFKRFISHCRDLCIQNSLTAIDDWSFKWITDPRKYQEDGFNCGPLVIEMMDKYGRGIPFDPGFNPNAVRPIFAKMILQCSMRMSNCCIICCRAKGNQTLASTCKVCTRFIHHRCVNHFLPKENDVCHVCCAFISRGRR
ncbi:hypothetical protein QAD02_014234 [Eretmocerus hayati]|uniref:Uncharacterized protein n=1 Tax=Eretmocerus hayati TaxID=131215 RepID=A0ACC2P7K4_9HYME|nr:hypothetical protein QAD02_014234 [Eretmocerus hayati]